MSFPEHLAELERRLRARFEATVDELRAQYDARLREASEQLLSSVASLRPAVDPLAGVDLSGLELAAPGPDRASGFADLIEAARALDRAGSQAEALDALLAGARRFAERAGLLLVRSDGVAGWGSSGFGADPFAGRVLAWSDDLLAELGRGRGAVRLESPDARRFGERFGLERAGERAVLIPLVLRDRVAAALYADASGDTALELEALQLLVLATAHRIELQALAAREFTPTLYGSDAAPGDGLPPWSGTTPAPAPPVPPQPAPEPVARFEPEPAEAAFEPIAATEPELAVEPEPFEPEEALETVFEPIAAVADEVAAEPEAWVAETAEPAAEEETDAGAAGFDVESEEPAWSAPEPGAAGIEAAGGPSRPEPAPAAPLGDATVRIPAYREPEPEQAPPEPSAAPIEETSSDLGLSGKTTQEIARDAATPGPAVEEDETVLMRRSPQADLDEAPTAAHAVDEDATVLTRRGAEPPPAAEEVGEDTADRTAARAGRSTEVAPPPDVRGPGLAFGAARPGAPASGDNALHDEARRLARLLVSEIKLYNEEQVLEGRRNRDLYARLKEDIDRSRQIYEERVHDSVRAEVDYFHQELVRSLGGGDARALGM